MNELFRACEQRSEPIPGKETKFGLLERSACPEDAEIRRWMESWFRQFPVDHREPLRRRLQSKDPREFMSAYFELQVFAVLRRLDCDVEVHPCLPRTLGTVDFRAVHGQDEFYIEATVCGVGQGLLRSNDNERDAERKIRKSFSAPHSDVRLRTTGDLERTLSSHRVSEPIEKLLAAHTQEDVLRSWEPPKTVIEEGDWKLEAELLRPTGRGCRGVIRGPNRTASVDGVAPLANALSKKAEDWKRRKMPDEAAFLIAVNVCHSDSSLSDREEVIYKRTASGMDRTMFADYLTRVAGVIFFSRATLGRGTARVRMYGNPQRHVPDCLEFLRRERTIAELTGSE